MAEERNRPRLTDKARAEAEARNARLAERLRANLKRRKAQARARAGAARDDTPRRDR